MSSSAYPKSALQTFWAAPSTTVVGLAVISAGVVLTGIVMADDLFTIVRRVGWQSAILIGVLAATFALRNRIVSRPSGRIILGGTVMWVVGVAASVLSLGLAGSREAAAEVQQSAALLAQGLNVPGESVSGLRFDDKILVASNLQGSTFSDVGFAGADLSQSDFRGATFIDVDFSGARLCAVDARGADFARASNFADVVDYRYMAYDSTTVFPEGFQPDMINGLVEISEGTRTSFIFNCDDKTNRVLRLEEAP